MNGTGTNIEVHYLDGGHCTQWLCAIDGRSLRRVRFHAVFLAFRHPREGWIICDTGYGARFFEATRRPPFRFYRWATPVTPRGTTAAALAPLGVLPGEVRHVIITHFHADHIGGLDEFPNARVHCHEHALAQLRVINAFAQTRAAFLPALLPKDIDARLALISTAKFSPMHGETSPFPVFDLFGDGLLRLVELPGHAPGQIGVEYTDRIANGARTLYCADAFWHSMQITRGVNLRWPATLPQWDIAAYRSTVTKLRALAQAGTHRLLACHDEQTQRHVENPEYEG